MGVIFDDTVDGTNFVASRRFIKPNAFGTQVRVDNVSFLHFVIIADGFIGTFRLANVAIDTVGRDFQCHSLESYKKGKNRGR